MEAQWTQREMEALEEASEARKMADLFLKVLEWRNVYPFFISWNLCNLICSQIEPVRVLGQFETQPWLDFSHTNASLPEMARRRRMQRRSLRRSDRKHKWRLKLHEQPHSACSLRLRSNLTVRWVALSKRYATKNLLGHRKTTPQNDFFKWVNL